MNQRGNGLSETLHAHVLQLVTGEVEVEALQLRDRFEILGKNLHSLRRELIVPEVKVELFEAAAVGDRVRKLYEAAVLNRAAPEDELAF